MANVVKKGSISFELAQKMVDKAVAKARELGVSENVAILDDGGNLEASTRMDGAPIPTIEMAQNKAYTALFGISTQEFFNFIQTDPFQPHFYREGIILFLSERQNSERLLFRSEPADGSPPQLAVRYKS